MKYLSTTVQKLSQRLRLKTDEQTGQTQYAFNHLKWGHKNKISQYLYYLIKAKCVVETNVMA